MQLVLSRLVLENGVLDLAVSRIDPAAAAAAAAAGGGGYYSYSGVEVFVRLWEVWLSLRK